jgi:carboxyl-terminal processing protease
VLPLNDTVAVKITTARYYAPSGRCIQRRERRDPKQADTLMFATKAGRVVRSAQGIVPDSTITDSIYTPSVAYLVNQGAFADFAARQSAGMSAMPEAFRVTPRMVDDFIAYLAARPSSELNPALEQLDSAIIAAERQHLPAETIAALKSARAVVLRDMSALLRRESATLKVLIESELRTCLGSATDGTTTRLKLDPVVAAGQRMVASARYTAILRTESNGDQ